VRQEKYIVMIEDKALYPKEFSIKCIPPLCETSFSNSKVWFILYNSS